VTCASQFRWTSSARSDAGLVREINEDACLDQSDLGRWAVADGMGGHAVGDLASRLVIDALSSLSPPSGMQAFVADARQRLQTAIARCATKRRAARCNASAARSSCCWLAIASAAICGRAIAASICIALDNCAN